MILNSISLKNFRNFAKKEISFSKSSNLIVGPNASGKTNILEAIYLLATGKSLRVRGVESEMIGYNQEIARVRGEIKGNGGETRGAEEKDTKLEIVLTRGEVLGEKTAKKKYLVNGVSKRAIDFVRNLRAVYFGPEDLDLIIGSPSGRRKYLDEVLAQTDREYYRAILAYEKGLRSRNKILSDIREASELSGFNIEFHRRKLYFWDQVLIKNGNIITDKRRDFINFLNIREGFEGIGAFEVEYDLSTISRERLEQYEREEVAAGTTLVGPHRDDFIIKIRNSIRQLADEIRNLAVYGSRGEERLAILWLKLGEMEFIKEKTNIFPVLLLDDIFSELDLNHRHLVLSSIDNQQTIITSADLGMVEKDWLKEVKIIELRNI